MTVAPRPSGYTSIPHGLWTLPISERARCVLGWLWSHNDSYLRRMSVREAARQMGMHRTQFVRALDELEPVLLTLQPGAPGQSHVIVLDEEAWHSLHGSRIVDVTVPDA